MRTGARVGTSQRLPGTVLAAGRTDGRGPSAATERQLAEEKPELSCESRRVTSPVPYRAELAKAMRRIT